MAVDLVLEQAHVLGAPAPLAHVRAVALDEQREALVERAPERLAAVGVRLVRARRTTTGWSRIREIERGGGEGAFRLHLQPRLLLEQDPVQASRGTR